MEQAQKNEILKQYELYRLKYKNDFDDRRKQLAFVPVAADIIKATLEDPQPSNEKYTGLIQILKYESSDENIKKYLAINIADKRKQQDLYERIKSSGHTGFTYAGMAAIKKPTLIQGALIRKFLLDSVQVRSIPEAIQLVEAFEKERIPEVTAGIYSPWLYYLNPRIFPIANQKHERFLKQYGQPVKSYCNAIKFFNEVATIINEQDLGIVDYFAYCFSGSLPQNNSTHSVQTKKPLNLILYGPPGTGKTYSTIELSCQILGFEYVDESEEDKRTQQRTSYTEYRERGHIQFITFHQNMAYEDFIEGIKPLRPAAGATHLQYDVVPGIFKKLCIDASMEFLSPEQREALKDRPFEEKVNAVEKIDWSLARDEEVQPYVLIIDEINRGNIAQIFGELITLIETDKRLGEKEALSITLPYSKSTFGVPPNLYIIGTMNTADRSVEALDTALRRRFEFEGIFPEPQLLEPKEMIYHLWVHELYQNMAWDGPVYRAAADNLYQLLGTEASIEDNIEEETSHYYREYLKTIDEKSFSGLNLATLLEVINKRLTLLLDRDHTIGHAWLMQVYSLDDLKHVFRTKIIPLLYEYFYNNTGKIGLVLGDAFMKVTPVNNKDFAAFSAADEFNFQTEAMQYELRPVEELTLEDFISIYNPDIRMKPRKPAIGPQLADISTVKAN